MIPGIQIKVGKWKCLDIFQLMSKHSKVKIVSVQILILNRPRKKKNLVGEDKPTLKQHSWSLLMKVMKKSLPIFVVRSHGHPQNSEGTPELFSMTVHLNLCLNHRLQFLTQVARDVFAFLLAKPIAIHHSNNSSYFLVGGWKEQ